MTNYLQLIAVALSYNLHFPAYISDSLGSAQKVGAAQEVFLSFDCLLMSTRATEIFNNVSHLKVMCMALIPPVFIVIAWTAFAIVFVRNPFKFKRYSCITIITIWFLFYPSLTEFCFRIFKCNEIGNGESRTQMDVTAKWWSPSHLKWIFSLGVPMLLIYVIAMPIFGFAVVYKFRRKLNEQYVINYIILLYQGLDYNWYYWEFVNTTRKAVLLAIYVFLANHLKVYKALFGVLVLFLVSMIQGRLNPYKVMLVNRLQYREMVATTLTLYSGVIYLQEEDTNQSGIIIFQISFFIIVIIANVRFVMLWIYAVAWVYRKKPWVESFAVWYKKTFCISVPKIDEDIMCYKLKITTADDERSGTQSYHYRSTIYVKRNTSYATSKINHTNITNLELKQGQKSSEFWFFKNIFIEHTSSQNYNIPSEVKKVVSPRSKESKKTLMYFTHISIRKIKPEAKTTNKVNTQPPSKQISYSKTSKKKEESQNVLLFAITKILSNKSTARKNTNKLNLNNSQGER